MTSPARTSTTPLVLIVLAAGTVGYTYLVDRSHVSDADRAARSTDVFPSFRVEDVREVELTHGAETLVLDRVLDRRTAGDGSWTMTSPRRDPTDAVAVDALLRELATATRVRDVSAGDARGLDAPRVTGTVALGSLRYQFALGSDAVSPEGAAYMRVDGEGTFVVGRTLKVQLLRGADAYRDRTLVPYGASETARVEVTAADGSFLLQRRGTAFRVGGPAGLRASRVAVERMFEALAEARAEAFLDDAAADRALGPAPRVAVIAPRDAARPRVRFLVGGDCPSTDAALADHVVVVRTEPTRISACAARELADALAPPPGSLVDASPFAARADEIEEVKIEGVDPGGPPGPRIEMARRGNGWHERQPDERDLGSSESDSANALVASLAGARATQVRPGTPGEHVAARARVTVVRTGGEASEVVEVTTSAGGVAVARRFEDGALLDLPRAEARRFEPHPIALSGPDVWRASLDPGEVVAIEDTCSSPSRHLEFLDGSWKGRGPEAENVPATDLADAFARARADSWITERDDGTFGFGGDGSCTVTLTLAGAAEGSAPRKVGVTFGAAAGREPGAPPDFYARSTESPAVFLAPASLRDLATGRSAERDR